MAFPSSDYLDMISDRSDNYTSLAANTTVVHYYDDDNDDVWYPLPTLHPTFSTAVKENTSNLYATPLLVIALLVMVAAVVSLRRRSNPQRESKFDKIMLDEEIEECRKKSTYSSIPIPIPIRNTVTKFIIK